jgi:hypothetical protein
MLRDKCPLQPRFSLRIQVTTVARQMPVTIARRLQIQKNVYPMCWLGFPKEHRLKHCHCISFRLFHVTAVARQMPVTIARRLQLQGRGASQNQKNKYTQCAGLGFLRNTGWNTVTAYLPFFDAFSSFFTWRPLRDKCPLQSRVVCSCKGASQIRIFFSKNFKNFKNLKNLKKKFKKKSIPNVLAWVS